MHELVIAQSHINLIKNSSFSRFKVSDAEGCKPISPVEVAWMYQNFTASMKKF